tara:strand:- start:3739 stop:4122 length:384 start_codon:yes stop_codon:yes gene_type:complete
MKKIIAIMMVTQFFAAATFANTSAEWPEIKYNTRLIGKFMAFCQKAMHMQTLTNRPEEFVKNKEGVIQTHSNICSCIMDSFRINHDESLFNKEFNSQGTAADVPNFTSYFKECAQISNNIQILREGL